MDQYEGKYNTKSTSVKRLMREAQELKEATEDYFARPLEENLFEWHFTIRGPPDSDFSGGLYHGRILLPAEYPMKPPNIILLTPNGRFEVNKKICLSISGHHPETWQPSWSIRTALLALIAFMPTPGVGTIGSLDFTPEERRQLAIKSHSFVCPDCEKTIFELTTGVSKPVTEEEKSLINCVAFKGEEVPSSSSGSTDPSVKKSQVEGTSQSDLRFRTPSSPDATTGHVRENVALDNHTAEANNIHGSQNFPSNFIDRNRNLIIVLIVMTIGLLILRRLVES